MPSLQVINRMRNIGNLFTYSETGTIQCSSNNTECGKLFLKEETQAADSTFVSITHSTRENVKLETYR